MTRNRTQDLQHAALSLSYRITTADCTKTQKRIYKQLSHLFAGFICL